MHQTTQNGVVEQWGRRLSTWMSQFKMKKTDLLSKTFCFSCDREDFRVKITSSQISLGSRGFWRLELHQTSCANICCEAPQNVLLTAKRLSLSVEGGDDGRIYSFRWTVPFRVLKISRTQVGQWETTWANLAIRLTHDSACGWMWSLSNTRLSPASRCVLPATLILVIFYQAATVTRTETKTHSLSQAWLEDSAEFNTLYSSQARQLVL